MALRHSTGLKNFCLDSGLQTAFDGGTGRLNIYTGSQPASANDAASGTLLATLTLPSDVFDPASGGALVMNALTGDSSADASGTAGWFRFYRTGDTAPGSAAGTSDRRLDGTVGTSGADMTINNASIVAGGTVDLPDGNWTYNHAP